MEARNSTSSSSGSSRILTLAFLVLATGLAGCFGDNGTGPAADREPFVDSIAVTPSQDTLFAVDATVQFTAESFDSAGNALPEEDQFTWSSDNTNVATVDSTGLATAVGNGTAEIEAATGGVFRTATLVVAQVTDSVSLSSVTFNAIGATHQFDPSAVDANGNAVEDPDLEWVSSDANVVTVDSTGLATAAGNGQATITVMAPNDSAAATVDVSQSISMLGFSTQPSGTEAGQAINPAVEVAAQDSLGNTVSSFSDSVQIGLGNDPTDSATLSGTTTVAASSGVAVFDDLSLETAAALYTLQATAQGMSTVESDTFAVDPGPAASLAFTTPPSDDTAGHEITPSVEVMARDAFGNTATGFGADVTLALAADPTGGEAALSGTTTETASAGVATFTDLLLTTADSGYTVEATSFGLDADTSAAFDIQPDEPAQLAFVTGPSDTEGLEPISPAIEVAIQDSFGNRVTSSSANVTLGFDHNPTGDAMSDKVAAASNGVATFANRAIGRPSSEYTLQATSTGLTSAVSDTFAVYLTFTQVDAGGKEAIGGGLGTGHSCGVTVANHAYCWGRNNDGQLGNGTTTSSMIPVPVDDLGFLEFSGVMVGGETSCAVTTTNDAYCWGSDGRGALGDSNAGNSTVPVAVEGGHSFTRVATSGSHSCGITTGGDAYCWGDNLRGKLGDGTTNDSQTPVQVSGSYTWTDITTGGPGGGQNAHTCGVTDTGDAYCWGFGSAGQRGDGTTNRDQTVPALVQGGLAFTQVSAGESHTCGVTQSKEIYCWGRNYESQLGNGTTDAGDTSPVKVASTASFVQVNAGQVHTCALTDGSAAYCWGTNLAGGLGDGTTTNRTSPVAVSSGELSWVLISAGEDHTCAMSQDMGAYCWGYNGQGQLGDGTQTDSSIPVRIVQ